MTNGTPLFVFGDRERVETGFVLAQATYAYVVDLAARDPDDPRTGHFLHAARLLNDASLTLACVLQPPRGHNGSGPPGG